LGSRCTSAVKSEKIEENKLKDPSFATQSDQTFKNEEIKKIQLNVFFLFFFEAEMNSSQDFFSQMTQDKWTKNVCVTFAVVAVAASAVIVFAVIQGPLL
jgi:hypothetical protein